jgi:putative protease
MMTHLRDYYDWIWTLNGRGVAFSDAGFPVGPCGLCALSRLQAMGICSVKIVGREAPLWKKLASLKLVKAVLDQVRAGTPREKIILGARKLKGTADLCASGFACYYRDY